MKKFAIVAAVIAMVVPSMTMACDAVVNTVAVSNHCVNTVAVAPVAVQQVSYAAPVVAVQQSYAVAAPVVVRQQRVVQTPVVSSYTVPFSSASVATATATSVGGGPSIAATGNSVSATGFRSLSVRNGRGLFGLGPRRTVIRARR